MMADFPKTKIELIVNGLEEFKDRIIETNLAKNVYAQELFCLTKSIDIIKGLIEEREHVRSDTSPEMKTVFEKLLACWDSETIDFRPCSNCKHFDLCEHIKLLYHALTKKPCDDFKEAKGDKNG
jgi:hypothetical protein